MKNKLNPRLLSAAEFVRQGAGFADIGTDHAYLPIFLLSKGRIPFAVCSDINEGPLESAKANAAEAGLSDKMTFTLADGADALTDMNIEDFAICGMGGEMILDIVERADIFRSEKVRLILQPMSRQEIFRSGLYRLGFEIEKESYSADAKRIYVCMCVKYTGNEKTLSKAEAEICPKNAEIVNKGLQKEYLNKKKATYEKILSGKKRGNESTKEAEESLKIIEKYLQEGELQ